MTRSTLVLGTLIACTAASLRAQEAGLPFHRGQWGVNLNVGGLGIASGAGLLRFKSPHRAWVVDVSGAAQHSHDQSDTSGVLAGSSTQESYVLSARLGTRSYHAIGEHADRHLTFGISGQYNHQASSGNGAAHGSGLGAGAFMDLGAEWLVTPHLGLGASWSVALNYMWNHGTSYPSLTFRGSNLSLSVGAVQLKGALFF